MRILIGIVMSVLGSISALASDDAVLFEQLLDMANANDSEAQYYVGMMFNNGIGVDQDAEEALEWFLKSSAGSDALGAYKVGCYFAGQFGVVNTDLDKALEYKLIAAEAGYALAQSDVAIAYASQGDLEAALKWWNEAAHQGYSPALQTLSILYFEGEYVPHDMTMVYVYLELLFKPSDTSGDAETRASLDQVSSRLSAVQLEKAGKIISDWKIRPTPLTLRAYDGLQAAIDHIETAQ